MTIDSTIEERPPKAAAGAAAGSITAEVVPGLIWGFRIDRHGTAMPVTRPDMTVHRDDGWLWLHFNLADKRTGKWLASFAPVPKVGLDLFLSSDDTQRMVAAGSCVTGIIFDLVHGFDRNNDEFGHLRFALTERLLVTGRRRPLNSVEAIRQEVENGRRFLSAMELLKAVIGQLASGIERIADELVSETNSIEDSILGDLAHDERKRLGRVRLTTVRIHRRLNGLRTLFRRFAVDATDGAAAALKGSITQFIQTLDEIDHEVIEVRDRARLLQEEITIKLAEQTNRHLHVLSIVTALLLPPALVAGLFGMNLQGLPFTSSSIGFWWAVGLTLASSAAALFILRWMGVFRR